jgi:hypothetical protein
VYRLSSNIIVCGVSSLGFHSWDFVIEEHSEKAGLSQNPIPANCVSIDSFIAGKGRLVLYDVHITLTCDQASILKKTRHRMISA